MLSVKQGAVNTNFEVIGLTRLGIKSKSTTAEADALGTRPFELLPSPTDCSKAVVLKLVGSIEPNRCHASIHRTLNYNQERIQKILEGDAVLN